MIPDRIHADSSDRTHAVAPRERVRARPTVPMALGLALWAATWLAMLSLTCLSPPVDNVEQLTWVRAVEWGYYKHPPLPTWLIWPWVQLFGVQPWVSYILGALCTCGAIFLGWKLVVELAGRHVALLATLCTLCISYYNGRLYYYNHNIVLLLAGVAAAWFCWRAFAARSLAAWIGVGVMLGLGALAKYQAGLLGLALVAFWVTQRGWRDPLHRRGLAAAAGVAALIFSPHALWLLSHDFQPIRYALGSSLGVDLSLPSRSMETLRWVGDQLNRLSPALLLGGGLLTWARRAPAQASAEVVRDGAAAFLFCWGALPLLAIALLGVTTGAELQFQWGTAFMPLTCAWLMLWVGAQRWRRVSVRNAFVGFALVQALLAAINWAQSPIGIPGLIKNHARNFPSRAVAERIAPGARAAQGGPIRVIAGPAALAGTLALRLPERPLVLIDGDFAISPWVPPDLVARCGLLRVGFTGGSTMAYAARHNMGDGLWWAVTPPVAGAGPCPR